MGSLIEELRRRETAARAEADRLRARVEELTEELARAEEQVSRLVITREEVTRVLEEPPAADAGRQDGGLAGNPGTASPIGAVTVPPWQEGTEPSVLPRAYQDLLEVAADAGRPLRAAEFEVAGDSMIGKAIIDGDRVVVRRGCEVRNGDTVVAWFDSDTSPEDGEATLKTYKRVGGHVWLMPENPAYDPIPGDEAIIMGKVVYVSRTVR
jgi:hypothetical protein